MPEQPRQVKSSASPVQTWQREWHGLQQKLEGEEHEEQKEEELEEQKEEHEEQKEEEHEEQKEEEHEEQD